MADSIPTSISGNLLIAGHPQFGASGTIHGIEAASGASLEPGFGGASEA